MIPTKVLQSQHGALVAIVVARSSDRLLEKPVSMEQERHGDRPVGSSERDSRNLVVNSIVVKNYAFPVTFGQVHPELGHGEPVRASMEQSGFYAVSLRSNKEFMHALGLLWDNVKAGKDCSGYGSEAAFDVNIRPFIDTVESEAESILGFTGLVTDVQVRESVPNDNTPHSAPFSNFHVDVPCVQELFAREFYRKFSDTKTQGGETLGKAISFPDFMSRVSTEDGLLYLVNQEVVNILKEEVNDEEDDDDCGCSASSSVGGQLNCWFPLNRDARCAQPTLGLMHKDCFNTVMDACDAAEDVFGYGKATPVGGEGEEKRKLKEAYNKYSVHAFPELTHGDGIFFDGRCVLHSAIYVMDELLQRQAARSSIELRYTILSEKEIQAYVGVFLEHLRSDE